jgi:peptidoglycan hydrolase-like protein with peptidoglycan-binding domain
MSDAVKISKVLNQLRQNLGLGEKPKGSNSNFIVTWYNKNVEKIGRGPWCEMTNTWAMWTGGAKILKRPGRAYTVWAVEDAISGREGMTWVYGTKGMRAGDEVYYDWAAKKGNYRYVDHTGTVEKIVGDGTFYVLEGNQNDQLRRMHRDGKYVVGYIRFAWNRLPDPNPPASHPTSNLRILRRGVKDGEDIRHLQEFLRKQFPVYAKYSPVRRGQPLLIDGDFGPQTDAWVREFQRRTHIVVDGEVGPQTRAQLKKFGFKE